MRTLGCLCVTLALLMCADAAFSQGPPLWELQCPREKLFASDGADSDLFGRGIAIENDVAVIGAAFVGLDVGAAYVYRRVGLVWVEEARLVASDAHDNARFGWSVAISGETIVVGAPWAGSTSEKPGRVYVFERTAGGWSEKAVLQSHDSNAGSEWSEFGTAVDIHGSLIAVGCKSWNKVFVFERPASGWTSSVVPAGVTQPYSYSSGFGRSVALWSSDLLVVGDPRNSDQFNRAGAVFVYRRTGSTSWIPYGPKITPLDPAAGDRFGRSVAVFADVLVVGAWRKPDTGSQAGTAYVFVRNDHGTTRYLPDDTWDQRQKFDAPVATAQGAFGFSVSVWGDRIVVGAYGEASSSPGVTGAAYVFERQHAGTPRDPSDDTWIQARKLPTQGGDHVLGVAVAQYGDTILVGAQDGDGQVPGSGTAYLYDQSCLCSEEKFTAAGAARDDHFGTAVALWGQTVLVGAAGHDSGVTDGGEAYLLEHFHSGWIETYKLSSDPVLNLQAGDAFGAAVDLGRHRALIGAPGSDAGGDSGAAHVFERRGEKWVRQASLVDPLVGYGDAFGTSVAIAEDVAVVGAPFRSQPGMQEDGGVAIFMRDPERNVWNYLGALPGFDSGGHLGQSVDTDGQAFVAGAPGSFGHGLVTCHALVDGVWSPQSFSSNIVLQPGDRFGASVAIEGDLMIIGSPGCDHGAIADAGAVYVIENQGGEWTDIDRFMAVDPRAGAAFGSHVGIAGNRIVVGAPGHDGLGTGAGAGAAYVFQRRGSRWAQVAKITGDDTAAGDGLDAVAIWHDKLLVGAPGADHGMPLLTDAGAAYLVDLSCSELYGCDSYSPPRSLCGLGNPPYIGTTYTLGIDNPEGTQPSGLTAFLIALAPYQTLASSPAAAAPCGLPFPGWGMYPAPSSGELLVNLLNLVVTQPGPAWPASGPVPFGIPIPNDRYYVGTTTLYVQGAIIDPTSATHFIGLSEAVRIKLSER